MTEQNGDTPTTGEDTPPPLPEHLHELQHVSDWYGSPDRFLQRMSDLADAGGNSAGTPITLFVPGGMIAGNIESAQDHFRGLAEKFRDGAINSTETGELPEWADVFAAHFFEEDAKVLDDQIADEERQFNEKGTLRDRWQMVRYIHLRNVYSTVPGPTSAQLDRVRVQLSHVTGWTLGVVYVT